MYRMEKKLQKWETTRQLGCIHTGSNWEMGLTLFSRNETMLQTFFYLWLMDIPRDQRVASQHQIRRRSRREMWLEMWRVMVGLIHLVSQFAGKKTCWPDYFQGWKTSSFIPPKCAWLFLIEHIMMLFPNQMLIWFSKSSQTHESRTHFKHIFQTSKSFFEMTKI